jgi:hypothetical protein
VANLLPITIPVMLGVSESNAEIGRVDVPFSKRQIVRDDDGSLHLELTVDHGELRRRLAGLLREAADQFERGPLDADR